MTNNRSQSAEDRNPVIIPKTVANPYRGYAFYNIQQENKYSGPFAEHPERICRTSVTAAMLTNIDALYQLGNDNTERY
ncbi:hypothetical protein D3C78_1276910 [compost metagenome]